LLDFVTKSKYKFFYFESIGISIFSIIAFNYGDIGKNMFK